MTDTTRDLIQRMAKELDLYRQMVLDDCRVTHRLADEARAYLDQPEPEGPGPVDYRRWHEAYSEDCNTWSEQPTAPPTLRTTVEALAWANYCLARWGRPATTTETP